MERYEEDVPVVRDGGDVAAHDGRQVVAVGEYRAIPIPTKRLIVHLEPPPKVYALLALSDGTELYLEPFNTPPARRPAAELGRFDGRVVEVRGTVHRVMPIAGEGFSASCLSRVSGIREVERT